MSRYTATDLADGWEFKILRSATGAFKNPDTLRRVLEEEGQAGWVMVEKFDSQRVRLKHPAAAKARDSAMGFDPYRTTVGISEGKLTLIVMGCVFGAIAILLAIVFAVTR